MTSSIKQARQRGFTIIEVLIVLAIAGLIMLVVFLAVPALQRNARNNSRNNDVASILGAVNNYINSNNGSLPNSLSVAADGTLTVDNTGSTADNSITAKLGYYKSGVSWVTTGIPTSNDATEETVVVRSGAECNSGGTNMQTGSTRSIAANYQLEDNINQCKAS
jgi:prepilin-type N-terminal cleavage/methylation domain-containing protein